MTINYSHWMATAYNTRLKLAAALNIPRSTFVNVVNNEVQQDGFTPEDLSLITVQKLQQYVGSDETNADVLFALAVKKAEQKEESQQHVHEQKTATERIEPKAAERDGVVSAVKKVRGRPKKQASEGRTVAVAQ